VPRVLWIELTSKCPFACVFCSRSTLRGAGEHMDFALYRSLIAQLREPEILRLNYSGESAHYPHLLEAVRLARATGACTELVTTLSSLPDALLPGLVASGLERLTVSLHTLDPDQYRRIYGFGSVADLRQKLAALLGERARSGRSTPHVDFAFLAMADNLDQLGKVAAWARECGVHELFVHPVIRRDPIPATFPLELDQGRLRPEFVARLRQAVARVQSRQLRVYLSTPELDAPCALDHRPRPCPGPLPSGARIATCDQDPWETLHVLANGDLVTCEVRDRVVLGNLRQESLADSWHGPAFRAFRDRYVEGGIDECRTCPYKVAHLPAPRAARVLGRHGRCAELVRGWHAPGRGTVWSKLEGVVELASPPGARRLRLRGCLPADPNTGRNRLDVSCNGVPLGSVQNEGTRQRRFRVDLPLAGAAGLLRIHLRTSAVLRPNRRDGGGDTRELGFALIEIAARS
jgi:radical SAM protein with 4Fe4S-binding SPASM domain